MNLPEERWKPEEIVKVSLKWRKKRCKVKEYLMDGAQADKLWLLFHGYLQERLRSLLNMSEEGFYVEVMTLSTSEEIKFQELHTLFVEDGQGREYVFPRYGSNTLLLPRKVQKS